MSERTTGQPNHATGGGAAGPSVIRRSLLWKILQMSARFLTTTLFDLKVYNRRYVPDSGGVLLVANHQSYLDPLVVAVRLYRPVSFFAKAQLFEHGFFSWLIRSLHAFPVRQDEADIGAVKESIRRLREGHILNVYPEGSRTETGDLGPIEPGVALMVKRAGVPIVPVAILGSFQAWPKGRKLFRARPVRAMYGPPLNVDGLKAAQVVQLIETTLRDLMQQIRRRYQAELLREHEPWLRRRLQI